MDIYQILESPRAAYISHYEKVAEQVRSKDGEIALELLVRLNNVPDDSYPALYRIDVASRQNGQVQISEANLDRPTGPKKTTFVDKRGVTITVYPMVWNDVTIKAVVPKYNDQAIRSWYDKWLDTKDVKASDGQSLAGVIHSFHALTDSAPIYNFSIDMGSAPVQALAELISELETQGAKNINVGAK